MLDAALDLARKEKIALHQENYEDALEISRECGKLTNEAWLFYRAEIRDEYLAKLLELKSIQDDLQTFAQNAHETVRASLFSSKQERRRMKGYQMAVSQARM